MNGVENVIIARNGEVVRIYQNNAEIVAEIPTGKLGVDRKQLTPLDSQLVKNRKRIAYNCSVFISAVFDSTWKMLDLQISSIDILEESSFEELKDKIIEEIKSNIAQEVVKLNYNDKQIKEYLAASIRRKIYKATDIKPVVFLHVSQVN